MFFILITFEDFLKMSFKHFELVRYNYVYVPLYNTNYKQCFLRWNLYTIPFPNPQRLVPRIED